MLQLQVVTKTMTFTMNKLDVVRRSVNEYEIRNPPQSPTVKVFKLKRGYFFEDLKNIHPCNHPLVYEICIDEIDL